MALEYHLFTGVAPGDLAKQLDDAWERAGVCWTHASAGHLCRFDRDILKEEGYIGDFTSRAYIRLDKSQSVHARRRLQLFFRTLPEPKVVLFQMDPTDQDAFRTIEPDEGAPLGHTGPSDR